MASIVSLVTVGTTFSGEAFSGGIAMQHLMTGFETVFHTPPEAACFAPGRVNLIGEHTDYNGGHVLPCAIHLGIRCAAARRQDRVLRFFSRSYPETGVISVSLDALHTLNCWADYPVGVIRSFEAFGYRLPGGADLYFTSDLPDGAGLSSSAALETATGVMLRYLFSLPLTQQELAVLGQFAENRFIGVNCGIMDQFASAMGKSGHALLLDAHTLSYQYAPLGDAALVIVNSGVRHSLAASAYNDRRRECESARSLMKVPTLCSLTEEDFDSLSGRITDGSCLRRARHTVTENSRTLAAVQALTRGDKQAFGRLMNASHASLRDDFEVSCQELDFLAETAQGLAGVYGSRMTGGGFGGCTVSLMERGAEQAFIPAIQEAYRQRFHVTPAVYSVTACDGAKMLSPEHTDGAFSVT